MTFKPKGLGHVNIYVRNAERSREWYEKLLGLHTYDFQPGRAAFMSANMEHSHEVALMELGDDADGRRDGQVGLNHMAWQVGSLSDLEEFYHRMQEMEVPIERVADHGLSLGIYFRDPDGNGIEVYYETPREKWHRQDGIFMGEGRPKGQFPGPWDEVIARQEAAAS